MQDSNPYPIFASHLKGNAANKKQNKNGVVVQLVRIPACHKVTSLKYNSIYQAITIKCSCFFLLVKVVVKTSDFTMID